MNARQRRQARRHDELARLKHNLERAKRGPVASLLDVRGPAIWAARAALTAYLDERG